ncbi:MAG: amidohydrolase family protein [Candidatus Loosdrechtia sp.]|uniref:amidohydrolase family protein n=1 Tax=Candidatus Loosdrechtia sp. TaxID=3101272 RepID=UPI003A6432AA|nr:MAG: amidohydrolase family protein [Candidatus Jettenia sp. AMX2]
MAGEAALGDKTEYIFGILYSGEDKPGFLILIQHIIMIIKAKYLITDPENCIENGAVVIQGTKIYRVDTFDNIRACAGVQKVIDLGNAVILPGLINIHTHLDLTNLQNRIKPTSNFTHWVFQIIGAKMQWKEDDYISSLEKGIQFCIESGTTTAADIASTGYSFSVLKNSPLRKVVYKEIIGLNPGSAGDAVEKVQSELSGITGDNLLSIGISPHAPYSVSKELYQVAAQFARDKKIPACTHIAETQDEIEFLLKGTGNLPVLLRKLRVLADNWQPPGLTPIQYLQETGILCTNPILIHCNYITDEEISLIKSSGASVAFCPRSHHFFGHTNHPVERLLNAVINVGLGTDSLASNDTLSLLDEMKFLFRKSSVLPKTLLSMATMHGAKALGLESKTGQIKEGFEADLCGIRLPEHHTGTVYHQLLAMDSKNIFTMVAGNVCYEKY